MTALNKNKNEGIDYYKILRNLLSRHTILAVLFSVTLVFGTSGIAITNSSPIPQEQQEVFAQEIEDCFDGFDNDGDFAVDSEDTDCITQPPPPGTDEAGGGEGEAAVSQVEDCFDGFDNDGDFAVDSEDTDCLTPSPFPTTTPEEPFPTTTPEEPFPTTTPEEPFPTTTPEEPFPTTTPEEPFPTTTPEEPFPTTTPEEPFPTTTPEEPFPTTTPEDDANVTEDAATVPTPPTPTPGVDVTGTGQEIRDDFTDNDGDDQIDEVRSRRLCSSKWRRSRRRRSCRTISIS